jgi:hypothetical protein
VSPLVRITNQPARGPKFSRSPGERNAVRQRGQPVLAAAGIDYGMDPKFPEYQVTRKSQLSSIDANFQIDEIDEVDEAGKAYRV